MIGYLYSIASPYFFIIMKDKDILNIPNKNILLELPTSYGKTKKAIDIIVNRKIKDNILIVVPRLCLINTWKKEFKKWKKEKYIDKVTFVTYVSLPKMAGHWKVVVFDECHHLSERCREALQYFTIDNSILLSATVNRNLKQSLIRLFEDLYIYKIGIKDATEEGRLPEPTVYLLPLKLDNIEPKFNIIRNKSKDNPIIIPYKEKWKYINIKNRCVIINCTQKQYYDDMSNLIEWYKRKSYSETFKNMYLRKSGERLKWLSEQKEEIVKHILKHIKNKRSLTFCKDIAQTQSLGSYCINSQNKDSDFILELFNNKKINHITACNMLDEGVNLTDCQVGIYATLNSSERMIIQKMGRLLRHKNPIIIIPYFKNTRDEEIVLKMCENYNPNLVFTINNIKEIKL